MFFAIALCACTEAPSVEEAIMDEIEQAVVLPRRASPISSYERNYAYAGEGTVVATDLLPFDPPSYEDGCDVALGIGRTRPCTDQEMGESIQAYADQNAKAGQRRWFPHVDMLPYISDAACGHIDIEYDRRTRTFREIACALSISLSPAEDAEFYTVRRVPGARD